VSMATPIRVPGQYRPQHAFRISMGERTDNAMKASDRFTIRRMRPDLVVINKVKVPVYDIHKPMQNGLIAYLKERNVPNAAVPQRVPVLLAFDDPAQNVSGMRALYGGTSRPVCCCSEWREKTPDECRAEGLEQTCDEVRNSSGMVPESHIIGTASREDGSTCVCNMHTCQYTQPPKPTCKYHVKATFMLRDFIDGECPMADFVTTSRTTWHELHYNQLRILNTTAALAGKPLLSGIPLWLIREERPTTSPAGHKTIVPYATLTFDGPPEDAIRSPLAVGADLKRLAEGVMLLPSNTAELAEFHPDIPVATAAEWQDRLEALLGRDGYRLSDSEIEHVVDHCQQHGDWEAVFTLYETEGPSASINGNPVPMVPEQEPEPLPEPEFDLPCDLAVLPTQKQAAKALKDAGWNAGNLRHALALVGANALPDDDPDGLWRCIQAVHWYAEQNSLTDPFADLIADARMAEAEQASMDFDEAEVG